MRCGTELEFNCWACCLSLLCKWNQKLLFGSAGSRRNCTFRAGLADVMMGCWSVIKPFHSLSQIKQIHFLYVLIMCKHLTMLYWHEYVNKTAYSNSSRWRWMNFQVSGLSKLVLFNRMYVPSFISVFYYRRCCYYSSLYHCMLKTMRLLLLKYSGD